MSKINGWHLAWVHCSAFTGHEIQFQNLEEAVSMLLFVNEDQDGAQVDVVTNNLDGNHDMENSTVLCFGKDVDIWVMHLKQFEELPVLFDHPHVLLNLIAYLERILR